MMLQWTLQSGEYIADPGCDDIPITIGYNFIPDNAAIDPQIVAERLGARICLSDSR